MTQDLPGSLTDGARRHVADVEARIVGQREILRATQVDRDHKPAALAALALVTMEAEVSLLREHLRELEDLHALE